MSPRPSRPNRDPDRVPGAPPGYRPIDNMLGACDRCGVAVSVHDPQAKSDHERFHAALRIMWATAQQSGVGSSVTTDTSGDAVSGSPTPDPKRPPTRTGQEVPPPQADRPRAGGHQQGKPGAGTPPTDAAAPPGVAADVPPQQPPGGTSRIGRGARAREADAAPADPELIDLAVYERRISGNSGRWAR